MRKLTLVLASAVATVSLVAAGTAAAAGTPSKTPLVDAVAARLGVTPDHLRAAFTVTIAEGIDQAVAAKTLTPEQAAKLKQRIAQAQATGPGAGGELMKKVEALKQRLIAKAKQPGSVGKLLKMSRAEIRADLRAGRSLAEIAAGKGLSRTDLVTAITAPAKERLAKAVAMDKLTQARADELVKRLNERVTRLVDFKRAKTA